MRIAIIDDDDLILDQLSVLIGEFFRSQSVIVDEYTSVIEYEREKVIINDDVEFRYDLIFLDIEMQIINGIDFALDLREMDGNYYTQIVFISSHSQYAMELFKVNPFGFLVKPFGEKQVNRVLQRFELFLKNNAGAVYLRRNRDHLGICYADILYIKYKSKSLIIKVLESIKEGEPQHSEIVISGQLDPFYKKLDTTAFFRINKDTIVNLNKCLDSDYKIVKMIDGVIFTISRKYWKEWKDIWRQTNISQ